MPHRLPDRRLLAAAVLALGVLGTAAASDASAGPPIAAAPSADARARDAVAAAPGVASPTDVLRDLATLAPEAKVERRLLEAADAAPKSSLETVAVIATARVDLGADAREIWRFSWPAGEIVTIARVPAGRVRAIAESPAVIAVEWADPSAPALSPPSADAEALGLAPFDAAEMRRRLDDAPGWTESSVRARDAASGSATPLGARGDGAARPQGWYDVDQGHAAREAWDLGYRGDGVAVAVLDYETDFAQQDLQGTWRVLPAGHPYGGWPQAFDPNALYLRMMDAVRPADQSSVRTALGGMVELYQSSPVEERDVGGRLAKTACFKPLQYLSDDQPRVLGPEACDYVVPESRSGMVRFGHHPDSVLMGLGARPGAVGEWTGVLIVDASEAGRYDTVYVDVDNDRDFTDDKPLTKADPLSWRDVTNPPDGIADLGGGLLYYVSDGQLTFPGAWLYGITEVPAAGTMVGLLYPSGDHGTMCASAVASQGRLKVPSTNSLEFRDLPGDHRPPAANYGMSPGARLVSVGSVYGASRLLFEAGWRYTVFGTDPARTDDDIQVASNSYGFSDGDDDGWDASSRLVDYYVRTFAPTTTFLVATGNGAPGYGTITPPKPEVAMGIAASTQSGSTGYDSITDTLQIAFGDIASFSNRGPAAIGGNGPHLSADGADAAGAYPINFTTSGGKDGSYANATWGGTSRSTPVVAGALALVQQAFRQANGRWPDWSEARSLLMAGARYAGYDTFAMGAGVLDAGDAVRIAAGKHGLFASPSQWTAGGYRGTSHPAFAKVMAPGEAASTAITLTNPSAAPIDVALSGRTLRRIGSYEQAITTTLAAENASTGVPDYLVPIDRARIPSGTELMVVRGIFPMSQFDVTGPQPFTPYSADNGFSMGVMQHTDINGDGRLWTDENGNGVVNAAAVDSAIVDAAWDDIGHRYGAIEGDITPPLTPEGLAAPLAWFGRGCDGDPVPQSPAGKIALIERGVCNFSIKILNAQNAGAIGVIVYSDSRPKLAMGGSGAGIAVPGVMVDNAPGLEMRQALEAGKVVEATVRPSRIRPKGLDGGNVIDYAASEIQQYEYMRVGQDSPFRNNYVVPVHHPLERWSDGLYVCFWHSLRNAAVPVTNLRVRIDFYAYQPWDALSVTPATVSVPARGAITVQAGLRLPGGAAPGGLQGAIFADYARGEGDVPVAGPGGYELPQHRLVIPVNVNVAPRYDWRGAITLGGKASADLDAPYPNSYVRGAFNWAWRPESGDWRFFFVDAASPPANTFWVHRTTLDDPNAGQADIDTRVYAPVRDPFSDPGHDANDGVTPPYADPAWYGPYTLGLLTRSPYLVRGSVWPFDTSSGGNEDWLAAPAGEGLHEVMLDNVLFSGASFELPFESTVASLQVSSSPVLLFGDECTPVRVTSTIDMPGTAFRGFGTSVPTVFDDEPIRQDDPSDRNTSSFKTDVPLATDAGRFTATLSGRDGDDLDLVLLRDADGDGQFAYPDEAVAESAGATADERIAMTGIVPSGAYQVWVHGYTVQGGSGVFDLDLDVVTGTAVQIKDAPTGLPAGQPVSLDVCADTTGLSGQDGPANGILVFGPEGAPTLLQLPVIWMRHKPTIFLPFGLDTWELARP